MQISVSFEERLNAHVFRLSGETAVDPIILSLEAVYNAHDPSQPLNMIFVDTGLTQIFAHKEFTLVMQFVRDNRPPCPGRTALVGGSDYSFGSFRMGGGIGGKIVTHLRVFRTEEEAEAWILAGDEAADIP
jgi:hypothetical protein